MDKGTLTYNRFVQQFSFSDARLILRGDQMITAIGQCVTGPSNQSRLSWNDQYWKRKYTNKRTKF
jgi:hypothetical protein